MHGEVSETQIAGFLIALRTKGETVEELAGLARTMRALAAHVPTERDGPARHRRHGRRAQHLQRLHDRGADRRRRRLRGRQARQPLGDQPLRLGRPARGARRAHRPRPRRRSRACIDEAGFGFMFAPAHHQATRFVVPVRRELAVRTIFNLLGPLTNPAGARRQLIGVSDARFLETIAGALARLGVERALVVAERGRPRRGLRERPDAASSRSTARSSRSYVLDARRRSASASRRRPPPTARAAARPRENAAVTRAILEADAGQAAARRRGARADQRRRRDLRGGRADTIAEGVEAARAGARRRRARRRRSSATSRPAAAHAPAEEAR